MSKQTILVLPIWYPSKANPYAGAFFKEQIELLSQNYNFIVLKYRRGAEYKSDKSYRITLDQEYQISDEHGFIKEYSATSYESLLGFAVERLKSPLIARKNRQPGVGIYHSKGYKQLIKATMSGMASELEKICHIDMVYGISAMGIAYESYAIAQHLEVPLIFSEHGPFPYPGTTIADTDKLALEAADAFLAISNDKIRQIMLQNISLKHITYIGNLIDESMFVCKRQPHDVPTLLIVAANSFFKNYDMFIETMDKLNAKTDSPFKIIIAGYNANKGYSEGAESLEKKIAQSSFADKVELIQAVPRDEMSDLYNRADAYVMTSIQEGQPVSAIEAACCGLPIFSTRCGGVEDYVTDEIGRITPITDSDALSEYLRQFVEKEITFDPDYIRSVVVGRFGREAYARTFASACPKTFEDNRQKSRRRGDDDEHSFFNR